MNQTKRSKKLHVFVPTELKPMDPLRFSEAFEKKHPDYAKAAKNVADRFARRVRPQIIQELREIQNTARRKSGKRGEYSEDKMTLNKHFEVF